MIIAIDGPAGSGKSTVAKLVAKRLGCIYLDTGAIYRSLGYLALKNGVDMENGPELARLASTMELQFSGDPTNQRVILNGEDVTEKIRTEEIGMAASKVSRHPEVRAALLQLQRDFAEKGCLVAEGRDTGTVVFPNAHVKVFLTASPEVRARRRYNELLQKGVKISFEEVLESVKKRDAQDSSRKVAPLKPADDAVIIDTSHLSIDQVVERILELVERWKEKLTNCS